MAGTREEGVRQYENCECVIPLLWSEGVTQCESVARV